MSKTEKNPQPDWLRRVQEQSWEPELLISGLVLFALFQMPELIDSMNQYLERHVSEFFYNSTINETISALLKISVYVLISGFIAHIFFRSIWAAYVGLSYLYEDGFDLSELRQPEIFSRPFKESGYIKRIITLEKICSGIFSTSFLFFMIILGLINVGLILGLVVYFILYFLPGFRPFLLINLVFLVLGPLYVIDLFTLGLLRRIPYLRMIYYPFYRIGRIMMLAPLYEDIYYGFLTHNKKWKMSIVTVLFTFVFIFSYIGIRFPDRITNFYQLDIQSTDETLLFNGHYMDRTGDQVGRAAIPSDVINGQVLRLFIPHFLENELPSFTSDCVDRYSGTDITEDQKKLNCLNELYQVRVNDSVSTAKGLYQFDPQFNLDGMVFWQDISYLGRGPHKVSAYRLRESSDTLSYQRIALIEFFKDSEALE